MTPDPRFPASDPRAAATRVLAAADLLWTTRRERWSALPPEIMPRNLDEAYAVQVILRERMSNARGRIAGWKLALVSPAAQRSFGLYRPILGAMYEATVQQGPARLRSRDFVRLNLGCTLAFRISRDLPAHAGPYVRQMIARAVSVCVPAIELIDDRGASGHATVAGLQLVAENGWNAGLVLGAPIAAWDRLDLARMRGRLSVQGRWVADGLARELMGHPLDAITWLANELPRRGSHLRVGDWAACGPFLPLRAIAAGEEAIFSFGTAVPLGVVLQ